MIVSDSQSGQVGRFGVGGRQVGVRTDVDGRTHEGNGVELSFRILAAVADVLLLMMLQTVGRVRDELSRQLICPHDARQLVALFRWSKAATDPRRQPANSEECGGDEEARNESNHQSGVDAARRMTATRLSQIVDDRRPPAQNLSGGRAQRGPRERQASRTSPLSMTEVAATSDRLPTSAVSLV